jgi:hypothetical protein
MVFMRIPPLNQRISSPSPISYVTIILPHDDNSRKKSENVFCQTRYFIVICIIQMID